jgi:hypothetical protein
MLLLIVLFDQAQFVSIGSPPFCSPDCVLSPVSISLGLLSAGEVSGITNLLHQVASQLHFPNKNPYHMLYGISHEALLRVQEQDERQNSFHHNA